MIFRFNKEIIVRAEEQAAMLFQKKIADTTLISIEAIDVFLDHAKTQKELPKELLYHFITRGYLIPAKTKLEQKEDIETLNEIRELALVRKSPLNSLYAPETIHFSLTNACNQKCIGCFYSRGEVEEEKYLDSSMFRSITDRASVIPIRTII